jgi:16S rRNA (uracil1498-N3)-methyltransferase
MKKGESLKLTDGKGNLLTAEISNDHKKHCGVKITDSRFTPHDSRKITIAISLLKNSNRFEWFLEKVTEIGVHEIVPLICKRTERQKFREDRMQNILISAMLQSQQCWLPVLADLVNETLSSQIILIGPEGDFTSEEVQLAIHHHFDAVSLGDTRLRAETAGIVAATILKIS